jgi:hypothetical protein
MIYYDILGISEYQLIGCFFDYENHNWKLLVSEVGWEPVNTLKGHGASASVLIGQCIPMVSKGIQSHFSQQHTGKS